MTQFAAHVIDVSGRFNDCSNISVGVVVLLMDVSLSCSDIFSLWTHLLHALLRRLPMVLRVFLLAQLKAIFGLCNRMNLVPLCNNDGLAWDTLTFFHLLSGFKFKLCVRM